MSTRAAMALLSELAEQCDADPVSVTVYANGGWTMHVATCRDWRKLAASTPLDKTQARQAGEGRSSTSATGFASFWHWTPGGGIVHVCHPSLPCWDSSADDDKVEFERDPRTECAGRRQHEL